MFRMLPSTRGSICIRNVNIAQLYSNT